MLPKTLRSLHPRCGCQEDVCYVLSRFICFNGYFYVSVDLACPPGRIIDVELEMGEETVSFRKTTGKPQYLTNLPESLHATSCVFDGLLVETGERSNYKTDLKLIIRLSGGTYINLTTEDLLKTYPEQYNTAVDTFWKMIFKKTSGGRLVELGARGSTSVNFRNRLPKQWDYVGVDIKGGKNVTHIGDAHRLSEFVEIDSVDVIYSSSVFEHLSAPWLVATECAKILKVGGLMFTATHNTWPLHEAPWDYWRYTKYSWSSLFNTRTGFHVLDTSFYEPTKIVPVVMGPTRIQLPAANGGWTGTACLAKKIAEPSASWEGYMEEAKITYPG